MSSVRSVVSVTGFNDSGDAVTVQGEPTRTLHFNTGEFSVSSDTSVTPPRAKVALKAAFVSSITALTETVAGLAESVTTLLAFKTAAEPYAVDGGLWGTPATEIPEVDGASMTVSVGDYQRVNMTNLGGAEIFTVLLPEANESRLGRRVRIAEIGGGVVGSPNYELRVNTTSGQTVDGGNVTLPYQLEGTFPRATFVVVENAGPTYEWSLEAET
jgi:phenylpyruvate tautomerase PptA (4-oxalocrotonate tautomerase family)